MVACVTFYCRLHRPVPCQSDGNTDEPKAATATLHDLDSFYIVSSKLYLTLLESRRTTDVFQQMYSS